MQMVLGRPDPAGTLPLVGRASAKVTPGSHFSGVSLLVEAVDPEMGGQDRAEEGPTGALQPLKQWLVKWAEAQVGP